jgi:mannose-6-phosphate isomerase-like protein (cupin superfamily)
MTHILKAPAELSFDKVGIKGRIFGTQQMTDKLEVVLIETEKGHETKIIEKKSDFTYYILEGSGYFEIEGEVENCEAGDLVCIPSGKKFIYKGKLKMLLICTPPWREDQEEEFYEG